MLIPTQDQSRRHTFRDEPIIVRESGILTTSYVICDAHNNSIDVPKTIWPREGNIDVSQAAQVTLWAWITFDGSQVDCSIKPVFCAAPGGGTGISRTDGAQTTGSPVFTSAGATFLAGHVGRRIKIVSGTNAVAQEAKIIAYNSATSITLDREINSGANASSVVFILFGDEFQDLSQDTTSGVTTLTPHSFNVPLASATGKYTFTFPVPAARIMRLYAKGSGTLTASDLILAYTLVPSGGE